MAEDASGEYDESDDYEKIRADLEEMLNARPTLDTEIPEFVALVNLQPNDDLRALLALPTAAEIRQQLSKRRLERRAALPRGTTALEVRLVSALMNAYHDGTIKTLGDLKCRLEQYSLKTIPGLGVKGIVYINSFLENYGLEPMGVIGSGYSPETLFKRFGLHSTKT